MEERTHSHRLAAVRVRGDTAGAAVRRRWERALTWPDKRGPGGRELVAEKRRAPAPPRGVAGRIVLASSRVVRACRAHVARGARRGRGHGHGEAAPAGNLLHGTGAYSCTCDVGSAWCFHWLELDAAAFPWPRF